MSASPPVPSSPSNATTSRAGLLSPTDKTKLDGVASGATATPLSSATPQAVGTATAGVSGNASRADHVHAHGTQASDATLHAVAIASGAAGFMSGTDKAKLDGLPSSAVPTTRTITAGAGLTGGGNLTADRTLDVVANADGSITVNADDVQVGILATDAQHGNRGGGAIHAAATTSTAGFMSAADKTTHDTLVATGVATQALATVRYYALDTVAGNDGNVGVSDVDMATAGAVAKKTWAGLSAIIPREGAGRTLVIAVKTATIAEDFDLRTTGYVAVHLVATTDFSDSATDRILSGAVTAHAGPGGGGVWTVTGTPTTTLFSVASGLPTNNADTGWRVRFTGNVTGALANVCVGIYSSTATDIVPMKTLPTAPAAGDTFLIEQPGVVFNNFQIQSDIRTVTRGIASAGTMSWIGKGSHRISFCEARTTSGQPLVDCNGAGDVQFLDTYPPLSGSTPLVGTSFRSGSGITVRHCFLVTANAVATLGGGGVPLVLQNVQIGFWGNGCVHLNSFMEALTVGQSCRVLSDTNTPNGFTWGRTSASYRDMKADGGATSPGQVIVIESNLTLLNTVITNTPSGQGAVAIVGEGCRIKLSNVTGATGNTGQGLLLGFCGGSRIITDGTVTVTGAGGDVLLGAATGIAGSALVAWADLATTNVVDGAGNDLVGTAGEVVGPGLLVTNKNGSALAVGDVVTSNGTSGQVTKAQADTLAHASGPLMIMVTAPANNAVGYAISPAASPWIAFDGTPTINALAYLSTGTGGRATSTVPAASGTNQRRRLGWVYKASGTLAQVVGTVENIPVTATSEA